MKTKQFLFFAIFLFSISFVNAQSGEKSKSNGIKKNFLKTNLTSIFLKNYSLQYERSLKKKISFALSARVMPNTGIPFKNLVLDAIGDDDPDAKETIEKLRLSNFAFTPELRFYLGKGYGKGFYIAPFYRYASFKSDQLIITYTSGSTDEEMSLSGKLTSHTGGLLFGAQWFLGKIFAWIGGYFGPHIGTGKGDFTGRSSQPLTPAEQNDLRQELEDLDIPFTDKTVTVNANGATLKLDGPWGGVRAGLSLGIRF